MKFTLKFSVLAFGLSFVLTGHSDFVLAVEGEGCELPNAGNLKGRVELSPGCTYFQTVTISESGTHLDCKGATLDGRGERGVGVMIDGRKKRIQNVTVENCRIQNFKNRGVNITSGIRIKDFSSDRDANYAKAPINIVINSNSTVVDSGKVGVYLEQATQRIKIVNNVIKGNGAEGRREGLAIDSSAHNTVMGNKFVSNAGGGIFIYKNCGESFSSGKSALRWQSSDFNVISSNIFEGERIGVWIASRQSKDLSKWDCGDPTVSQDGRFYEDRANRNVVEDNIFCSTATAVRVEGDDNTISRNRIGASARYEVFEPYKTVNKPDGRRTQGNKVEGNVSYECAQ